LRSFFTEARTIAVDPAGNVAWHLRRSVPFGRPSEDAIQVWTSSGIVTLASGEYDTFGPLSFSGPGTLHWTTNDRSRTYVFG
jgi:hypothetical protein